MNSVRLVSVRYGLPRRLKIDSKVSHARSPGNKTVLLSCSLHRAGETCRYSWSYVVHVFLMYYYTFSHCESASVQLRSADCICIVSWDTTPTKVASYRHSAPL